MKIQVLELPMEHVGEYSRTPYALIVSGTGNPAISSRYVNNLTPLINKPGGPVFIISAEEEIEL